MQTKKHICLTFLAFLMLETLHFIAGPKSLYAQQKKFTQTLEWQYDENAFEYKIEIKNLETGKSKFYETEDFYITLDLEPGSYRYRVFAIDFLGREDSGSEWMDFTVVKAKTPKVMELKENVVLSEENKNSFSIPIDVTSITEETQVVLINSATKEEIKGSLKITKNGSELVASEAVFPEVKEGSWKIKITNPSGLYSETEAIDIAKTTKKAVEIVKQAPEEKRASPKIMEAVMETEKARLAQEKEKAEAERIAKEKAERLERERLARAEEERLEKERQAIEEELKRQERIAAEEAARKEQERLAAEEAVRKEQERLAAEKAARKEQERLAAEEAARKEQERLAAEEAARKEQERIAAEEAARKEQERLAAEEAARKEQERLAAEEAERLERERLARAEEERLEKERQAIEEERIVAEKAARKEKGYQYKDVYFEVGASPIFNIYDGQLSDFIHLDEKKFVCGLNLKLGYLPFDFGLNKLGFEIDACYNKYNYENEVITMEVISKMTNLQLVYHQHIIKDKVYLSAKLGAGYYGLDEIILYNVDVESHNIPSGKGFGFMGVQCGTSLYINVPKALVIELGVDYEHIFIPEMPTGLLKTYANIGFRL